jgi:predicted nuclease of predicted toxin-antitoxin system
MKLKLDENFGTRTQRLFQNAGHVVYTVRQEELQGASDNKIYEVCCQERLCLVTLDLDFADVIRFPPERTTGIMVIRVPRNPSLLLLEELIQQAMQATAQMDIDKQLWIVEVGRIRVHQTEEPEG